MRLFYAAKGLTHYCPLSFLLKALPILFVYLSYPSNVTGQRGTSIHWPTAFIAKGHADDWNASSIVYYDWKQQAMRRDTLLAFPPSHFNPETGFVEPTKQPVMSSFIWKEVGGVSLCCGVVWCCVGTVLCCAVWCCVVLELSCLVLRCVASHHIALCVGCIVLRCVSVGSTSWLLVCAVLVL